MERPRRPEGGRRVDVVASRLQRAGERHATRAPLLRGAGADMAGDRTPKTSNI